MKKVFLLVAFLSFSLFTNAQDAMVASEIEVVEANKNASIDIAWQPSYKEALLKSKTENKPILIYFTGSDWCGACKVLKSKLFDTEEFKSFSDKNLVLYKADFPTNKDLVAAHNQATNDQLKKQYNQQSFPTMIMINEKGEVLGRKNGVYMTDYYYPFFKEIVANYKK